MLEIKTFCFRCLSTVKPNILRVVSTREEQEEMGEIKLEVQCPNCKNTFKYEVPILPKHEEAV
jgi:hypothetical protein